MQYGMRQAKYATADAFQRLSYFSAFDDGRRAVISRLLAHHTHRRETRSRARWRLVSIRRIGAIALGISRLAIAKVPTGAVTRHAASPRDTRG